MSTDNNKPAKKNELIVFVLITVFLFPLLSLLLVSGYGFSIWISQLLFAPTGY